MKRRTLYIILTIIITAMLVCLAFYLAWLWRDRVPDDKLTRPHTMDLPDDLWPQYRLTVQHDGRAHPNASLDGSLTKIWSTIDINEEYYTASKSSPAVDKDLIFIGADTGLLYAFWRENGTEAWSFQTRNSKNGIHGAPAFDNEKVYIGAYDGWLYALYKNNGTLAWESNLGDYIGSSPCLYDGVVYIGVEIKKPGGFLVGCDVKSGLEVFRSKEFGSHAHSTPSIDPNLGYAYIGANDDYVYCYDLKLKEEVWKFDCGGDVKSTPCIAGDILYLTSWDDKLHALDLSTGEEYFSFATQKNSMSSPSINSKGTHVYFGSHDEYIYCISSKGAKEHWKFKTNERILSSPTLVEKDNTVVCGSNDGYVYILDAETGVEIEKIDFEIAVTSVPVVVENQLYVFDDEGILHRFDAL
ncbi:MAG: PQQ-binding-like beta-propeller repeat protein [Thermoplasmata archaeon]|nr:MAG: PQQ-binding-like beta-propeller repeat protein [Thermoplasmata archaeon]